MRTACQGLLVLAGMVSLGVAQAQTAAPLTVSCSTSSNVVNTAYNHATEGFLASGSGTDPYWGVAYAGTQTGAPIPLASIGAGAWAAPVVYFTAPWTASPYSNANWIAPYAGSAGAAGEAWRYYRYRFNLDAAVNPANVSLQLSYYSDDVMSDIYVNGVAQSTHGPVVGAGSAAPGTHTLTQDWHSGTNEVVFLVRDYGWVTGLMVQALPSAVCTPPPALAPVPVPVPLNAAWALLALSAMVAGAGAVVQRRRSV